MPQNKNNARITIKDIAEHCNLSIGAVSSVLQNRQTERRIPEKTVAKVRAAIRTLGYMPDLGARRLRNSKSGKTPIVIALLSSYEAPLNAITGFLFELRNLIDTTPALAEVYEVSIVLELFKAGHLREHTSILTGNTFNAAIIANTVQEDDDFLSGVCLPYPNVLAGRIIEGYYGIFDDFSHGGQAAKLLKNAGRKNLGVIYGAPLTQLTRSRIDGFLAEAGASALRINANLLSEASGYEAMRAFLAEDRALDGVFAVTDSLAMGAYRAIREAGKKIPSDISVIGVGDYAFADYFDPPMTTVGVLNRDFARRGAELLIKQIAGELKKPEVVILPVKEILRASL